MNRSRKGGREDAPIAQNAEESLTTGIAAIGGKAKNPLQPKHRSIFDAFARNMLEIKISALGAVSVAREGESYSISVKPAVAGMTAPGLQTNQGAQEIEGPASM